MGNNTVNSTPHQFSYNNLFIMEGTGGRGVYMCHGMHVEVQEQPESALFPSEDSRKQTQVFRFGCKGSYRLTHVISPFFRISNNTSIYLGV